jgi:ubiquinone/menaquinone biosynthesis C-methylase UbiE
MKTYKDVAKVYFARRADTKRFDFNRDIEVPAMIKMIGPVRSKSVLDIGCGFGDHVRFLSKKNPKKIVGFDLSKELIDLAKSLKIKNAEFFVWDMNKKFKFKDSSFDIVYSSLAIHYAKDIDKFFKEVKRVLKKGGLFVFSTGHPIFNLINQSNNHLIGVRKTSGQRHIFGNYFDESLKLSDLGPMGKFVLRNFTFETLINTGLKNGFELVDYKDAKPVSLSRRIDFEKFKLTSTLPTFILFKFKKK